MLQDTRPPRGNGGPEPWRYEPNRVAWRDPATGLQCLILRGPFGALNGYVRVPRDHAMHGKPRGRQVHRLSVHGGITFSGCLRSRNMKRGHWFGFDCGHVFDLVPGLREIRDQIRASMPPDLLEALTTSGMQEVYRTVDYVRQECTDLAAQLARKGSR
jgi:hypothetical protein